MLGRQENRKDEELGRQEDRKDEALGRQKKGKDEALGRQEKGKDEALGRQEKGPREEARESKWVSEEGKAGLPRRGRLGVRRGEDCDSRWWTGI